MFSQHFLPCPAWFTPENLQVPPATIAASFHPGTPRSQLRDQEPPQSAGHPHCPSCRLPLPFLNAQSPHPCPSAPCLAVCTVCYCTEKGREAEMRQRGWRKGKAQHQPSQPQHHPPELASPPPERGTGWWLHGRCVYLPPA